MSMFVHNANANSAITGKHCEPDLASHSSLANLSCWSGIFVLFWRGHQLANHRIAPLLYLLLLKPRRGPLLSLTGDDEEQITSADLNLHYQRPVPSSPLYSRHKRSRLHSLHVPCLHLSGSFSDRSRTVENHHDRFLLFFPLLLVCSNATATAVAPKAKIAVAGKYPLFVATDIPPPAALTSFCHPKASRHPTHTAQNIQRDAHTERHTRFSLHTQASTFTTVRRISSL